jgi:endonuclease-3
MSFAQARREPAPRNRGFGPQLALVHAAEDHVYRIWPAASVVALFWHRSAPAPYLAFPHRGRLLRRMTRAERAAYVDRRLNELYPHPKIPLDHTNAFTLLVAVVLSAHTTDKSVNKATPELFALADTPEKMVRAPLAEIQRIIRPVGLWPAKSKNIVELSRLLVEKHGGEVPQTFEELEALPGVGHKTASVVMVQAFNTPAFPVDTHIHRLAERWGLSDGRSVEQTEADLKKLFPREHWSRLHLQIIYYGREHCTARGCDGTKCEICRALYPNRKPTKPALKVLKRKG